MTEEYKLFFELEDRLYKNGRPYDSLNDTEKKFYMISWLMMQVFNGGWYQWYDALDEDMRTERVEDVLDALKAIGVAKHVHPRQARRIIPEEAESRSA